MSGTTSLSFDIKPDETELSIQKMYLRLCQVESNLINVKIWILKVIIIVFGVLLAISLFFNLRK